MEMESPVLKDIVHKHHQSLVSNREPWDESNKTPCSACGDLSSGESYSCSECQFHLHKRCAEAPLEINHLHREHQHLTLQASSTEFPDWKWQRYCDICGERDFKFGYGCSSCEIFIDVKCALFTLNHGSEIVIASHEHPLLFLENYNEELKFRDCEFCGRQLSNSVYVCTTCSFCFHKKCVEAPVEISHPCHRIHALKFVKRDPEEGRSYECHICQLSGYDYAYRCSSCNFDIHLDCDSLPLVVEDKSHHEHPFNLLWKQSPFICNACGTEGNCVSYVCLTCHLEVHKDCTSLPRFIKSLWHRHPLSHNYFHQKMEHEERDCRICYDDEVKAEHGSYSCLKQDCNYVVHVKCATKENEEYEEIDANKIKDLLEDKPVDPSITCVFKANEFGEAAKYKHIFHEHDLLLEDTSKGVDDKQCDGCVDLISDSFYHCLQCNFLLHKSCAELPKTWDGSWVAWPYTLKSDGFFDCSACGHQCSGFFFFYNHKGHDYFLCLRCARISDTFKYPGYQHFLFRDYDYDGGCTACGNSESMYRSKDKKVALDYRCMTLPLAARHKCDKHVLKLTYGDESKDSMQHYCDICEKKRDPNHWFYMCSFCNNSAHVDCALGKYPLIKIGSMYKDEDIHPHPLTFVQEIYYYRKCAKCDERCLDLSLECAPCNYIVHWKCPVDSESD